MLGHCADKPSYAVNQENGGSSPLAMKAYIGGYAIDIDPSSNTVRVNGNYGVAVTDKTEYF